MDVHDTFRWSEPVEPRESERGAALLLAIMVALVLVFLGMGLLMQTNLGLQAASTDRWVVKALYAADAGAMLQVEMLQLGQLTAINAFTLSDDRNLPGLLHADFNVQVTDLCEGESPSLVGPETGFDGPDEQGYFKRHFYLRSAAQRTIGGLGGVASTAIAVNVTVWPFQQEGMVIIPMCFE